MKLFEQAENCNGEMHLLFMIYLSVYCVNMYALEAHKSMSFGQVFNRPERSNVSLLMKVYWLDK